MLETGALLKGGLYRIVRPLGQDEGGETYEAEQLHPERKVIVRALAFPVESESAYDPLVIDVFEENGIAFQVLEEKVNSEAGNRYLWTGKFGKDVMIKSISDPKPDSDASQTDFRALKKKKNGLWLGLVFGVLAVAAAVFIFLDRMADRRVEEADKSYYDELVMECRDSIMVWDYSRGTVPTDALENLKYIKWYESSYGRDVDGYDESSGLAGMLIEKMKDAKSRWEIAGEALTSIDAEKAQECYELARELGESIDSVEREVLEMEDVSQ